MRATMCVGLLMAILIAVSANADGKDVRRQAPNPSQTAVAVKRPVNTATVQQRIQAPRPNSQQPYQRYEEPRHEDRRDDHPLTLGSFLHDLAIAATRPVVIYAPPCQQYPVYQSGYQPPYGGGCVPKLARVALVQNGDVYVDAPFPVGSTVLDVEKVNDSAGYFLCYKTDATLVVVATDGVRSSVCRTVSTQPGCWVAVSDEVVAQ